MKTEIKKTRLVVQYKIKIDITRKKITINEFVLFCFDLNNSTIETERQIRGDTVVVEYQTHSSI